MTRALGAFIKANPPSGSSPATLHYRMKRNSERARIFLVYRRNRIVAAIIASILSSIIADRGTQFIVLGSESKRGRNS